MSTRWRMVGRPCGQFQGCSTSTRRRTMRFMVRCSSASPIITDDRHARDANMRAILGSSTSPAPAPASWLSAADDDDDEDEDDDEDDDEDEDEEASLLLLLLLLLPSCRRSSFSAR